MDLFTLAAGFWLAAYLAIGYFRGFWRSFSGLISLLSAYVCSVYGAPLLAQWINNGFASTRDHHTLVYVLCATAIFLIIGIGVRIGVAILSKTLPSPPRLLDQLAGAGISGIYGLLVAIVLIWSGALLKETWVMRDQQVAVSSVWQGEPPAVVRLSRSVVSSMVAWSARRNGASETVAEISATLVENPGEVLGDFKRSVNSREFRDIVNSREILELVREKDVEAVKESPEFKRLIDTPQAKKIQSLWPVEAGIDADEAFAERLVNLWYEVDVIKNNPEVMALYNDPEVQNFFQGDGTVTPGLWRKAQQLVGLMSRSSAAEEHKDSGPPPQAELAD